MAVFFGEGRTPYYSFFPTLWTVGIWRIWCQAALHLLGGRNQEDFYQTDTVPPSGRRWRERRRTGSVSCWSRTNQVTVRHMCPKWCAPWQLNITCGFINQATDSLTRCERLFSLLVFYDLCHTEIKIFFLFFLFFIFFSQVRLSQDTVRKVASRQHQQVRVQ